MKSSSPLVRVICYSNSDEHPPIINSTSLLARAGFRIAVLCRDNGRRYSVAYPSEAHLTRRDTRGGGSWRVDLGFTARTVRLADR